MKHERGIFEQRQFWPRPGRPEALGEIEFDRPCGNCGYNLRGLAPGTPCPECGSVTGLAIGDEPLPWEDRRTRWGFIATTCLAIVHPHDLARQVWRPARLDLRSAREFRRICLSISTGSLCAVALALTAATLGIERALWCLPLNLAAIIVWLNAATLEPVRFFRNYLTSPMLNRAEVIVHYTSAPLTLAPLQLLLLPVTFHTAQTPHGWLVAAGVHFGLLMLTMGWALVAHAWLLYETVSVPKFTAFMYTLGAALSSATTGVIMLLGIPAFAGAVMSRLING